MFNDSHYPPLVSPRSPSYERASREFLHPTRSGDPQVIALLSRLSEAEQNASQACASAAHVLRDESFAAHVREHAITHQERQQALARLITSLGGSPPTVDECRDILPQGLDAVANARSDATAKDALSVMREELGAAYGEAIDSPELNAEQRAALTRLAPAHAHAQPD